MRPREITTALNRERRAREKQGPQLPKPCQCDKPVVIEDDAGKRCFLCGKGMP